MARKKKKKTVKQTFTKGGYETKVHERVVAVCLTKRLAWTENGSGHCTEDVERILENIQKDTHYVNCASEMGDCVLKAILTEWDRNGCPTPTAAEEQIEGLDTSEMNLPKMTAQQTFVHMVKADISSCGTVHPRTQEARTYIEDRGASQSTFDGPTVPRQADHLARRKMTQFLNFMNNLFIYLQWVAIGFLRARYPNLTKKAREFIAEIFMKKICNWTHQSNPDELNTPEALALINQFRQVLGLDENDTGTKIDEKWIKKDLDSRRNKSIKLILRLSRYQIENTTDECQLRQIPISQHADEHCKGALYNSREILVLLRVSSEKAKAALKGVKQTDKDVKPRAFAALGSYLNYQPFVNENCRFKSFFSDGQERTNLNLVKTFQPRAEVVRTDVTYPENSTNYIRGDRIETTFHHGRDDQPRVTFSNGETWTGLELQNTDRPIYAVDPGVIATTVAKIEYNTSQQCIVVKDVKSCSTKRIYEESGTYRLQRDQSAVFSGDLRFYNDRLSQCSLKSPNVQNLAEYLDIRNGFTWIARCISDNKRPIFPPNITKLIAELVGGLPTDSDIHIHMHENSELPSSRHHCFLRRRKIMDNFTSEIKRNNGIVTMESGTFSPTAGGNDAAPLSAWMRSYHDHSNGFFAIIDCWNTSQKCPRCYGQLYMLLKGRCIIRDIKSCPMCGDTYGRDEAGAILTGIKALTLPHQLNRHHELGQPWDPKPRRKLPGQTPNEYQTKSRSTRYSNQVVLILQSQSGRDRFMQTNSIGGMRRILSCGRMKSSPWMRCILKALVLVADLELATKWLSVIATDPMLSLNLETSTLREDLIGNLMNGYPPFFNVDGFNNESHKNNEFIALLSHLINTKALLDALRDDDSSSEATSTPLTRDIEYRIQQIKVMRNDLETANEKSKYQNVFLAETNRSVKGWARIRKWLRKESSLPPSNNKSQRNRISTRALSTGESSRTRSIPTSSNRQNEDESFHQIEPISTENDLESLENVLQGPRQNNFGLKNLGQTCYLNTVLQMILSTRSILCSLLEIVKTTTDDQREQMPIASCLLGLAATNVNAKVVDPTILVSVLEDTGLNIVGHDDDIGTMLSSLFQVLNSELSQGFNPQCLHFETEQITTCSHCQSVRDTREISESGIIVNLTQENQKLSDSLKRSSIAEDLIITSSNRCCPVTNTFHRTTTRSENPPSLLQVTVTLREGLGEECSLSFDEIEYVKFGERDFKYELKAIGVFTLLGDSLPHYVAFCKNDSGWSKFDDSKVTEVSDDITAIPEVKRGVQKMFYSLVLEEESPSEPDVIIFDLNNSSNDLSTGGNDDDEDDKIDLTQIEDKDDDDDDAVDDKMDDEDHEKDSEQSNPCTCPNHQRSFADGMLDLISSDSTPSTRPTASHSTNQVKKVSESDNESHEPCNCQGRHLCTSKWLCKCRKAGRNCTDKCKCHSGCLNRKAKRPISLFFQPQKKRRKE